MEKGACIFSGVNHGQDYVFYGQVDMIHVFKHA
jgi:hypothetical protein